ncbi:hypothetical protein [Oceaniglobus indicus]|uniref:hypothetical protein n=1 Tax=Oceaniglobus indicus TaxID=2047749 RepID=UPI0011AB4E0C|nr:hypothetical protein [Oceaniglobus indicus]
MSYEDLENYQFELEHWRWCEHLSVIEASMLAVGLNPSNYEPSSMAGLKEGQFHRIGSSNKTQNYLHSPEFVPVFRAISGAAMRGTLPCSFVHDTRHVPTQRFGDMEFDVDPEINEDTIAYDILIQSGVPVSTNFDMPDDQPLPSLYFVKEPSWDRSSIKVNELRDWMRRLGQKPTFFFPDTEVENDAFRNPAHEHFSAELDYAVTVWQALLPERKFKGGVKAAIEAWIAANPAAWQGDEPISGAARDRIATLVNWNKGGGAPKTGG